MLKHISISKFASCDNTSFDLQGSITALIGRNGVGKTNVLKSIDWIGRRSGLTEAPSLPFPAAPHLSSVTLTLDIDGVIFEYQLGFRAVQSSLLEERLVRLGDQKSEVVFERTNESVKIHGEYWPDSSPGSQKTIGVNPNTPAMPVLVSLLPAESKLSSEIRPILSAMSGIKYYTLDEQVANARDVIFENEYAAWTSGFKTGASQTDSIGLRILYMYKEDKPLFDEFKSLMGRNGLGLVDVDVLEVTQNVPQEGAKETDQRNSKVYFFVFTPMAGMGGEGKNFFYSNLSAGTKRAMRMIVSLLFDKRSLMLVEQPEDSMHPGLLSKLIDLLRGYSDRTQFVFTTHSPYVLNILKPSEVLLASAPGGKTQLRPLTQKELDAAKHFLEEEGTFSEFLDAVESSEN